MAKPLKELYMGKSLDDLDRHTIVSADVQKTKMKIVLASGRKLLEEAAKFTRDGDEELAYISYMKYFHLLDLIHKKSDFHQYKSLVREQLGNTDSNMKTMDKLELLTNSLRRRYDSIKLRTKLFQITPMQYERMTPSGKLDKAKTLKSDELDISESIGSAMEMSTLSLITCNELFERIKENDVLIMDCRSSDDYELSHLTYPFAFNVPEEHIMNGMSAGKLQAKLNDSAKVLWSSRSVKNHVVLMDWSSTHEIMSSNCTITTLLDILQYWDPDVTYRSPIRTLDGGYEYFIMMYPTLCTNPSVRPPELSVHTSDAIDDIEYPSIHDITMKDDIMDSMRMKKFPDTDETMAVGLPQNPNRPSVDRSSKLAAIKIYEEKQMPIKEIMKEHQELLMREQQNDEQLQEASSKWKTIFNSKNPAEHGADKPTAISNDERELLYKILQLESTAEDYKMENNRLREELENYKQRDTQEKLDATEFESLKEATKRMETETQERIKRDEQRERERRERESQLAIAREHKRHMKPPADDEEGMSKAKIPQFDRSAKPQYPQSVMPQDALSPQRERIERRRDFSPIPGGLGPGLTGLKNLGNTCYMNSIVQCLSNTPPLTEYCITDKYKNYISRSNRTKGQVVEELAALIKVLWNGSYKCVASKDLRDVIGRFHRLFDGVEQQDSHEFLTILMDWLHSDLQTLRLPEKPRHNVSASEKAWLEFTKSKESLILHLFYGQIKSTVKCAYCLSESATYESFSNLSLELPANSNVCHLSQCMDMYFSGELIQGWNCPKCKQKRNAIKKLDISKLPPVLVIHLKRFSANPDSNGNAYQKKQNYVRFPMVNLDMNPYIAKSQSRALNPKTYDLYAVSNHYGTMEGGHYTAFCKSGHYDRWYKFDDQVVSPIDTSNVVSSAGYILFYTWLPPIQTNDPY